MRTTRNPKTQSIRLRLTERERQTIETLADQEEKSLSQAARDLLHLGAMVHQTIKTGTTGQ
jgi:predicted transcriptional regulator